MIQSWEEDTATWNTYDGTQPWDTEGAAGAGDRADMNLWDETVISSTGTQTRDLNSEGIATLQRLDYGSSR